MPSNPSDTKRSRILAALRHANTLRHKLQLSLGDFKLTGAYFRHLAR